MSDGDFVGTALVTLGLVFFIGVAAGFFAFSKLYKMSWKDYGIENLAHHHTEVDGVMTTNWYEIVINEKANVTFKKK